MIKVTCGKGEEYLTEDEKEKVNQISQAYFDKISNHIKDIEEFEVHLKCHKKEGKVKRYEVVVKVIGDGKLFDADGDEWDLNKAVKTAFEKILSEIEHRVRKQDK